MFLSTNRIIWFTSILLLLVGPVLGFGFYRLASSHENERAMMKFDEYVSGHATAIEKEFLACTEILFDLKSFFESSEKVTREEFASYTRDALARRPAIHALEWIPRIQAHERAEHEQQARQDGLENYRITDHLENNEMIPSPPREEYFPVYFIEPRLRNERARGFDMGSERIRREAMLGAAESGRLTYTDPLVLIQEETASMSILAIVPIEGKGWDEAAKQPERPESFVLLAFRVEDVVAESLAGMLNRTTSQMQFMLVDPDALGKPCILFVSESRGELAESENCQKNIDLGGQRWVLRARPTSAFISQNRTPMPLAMGIGVFLLWVTLGGLVTTLAVGSRDKALRKQEELLQSVCLSLNEGVIVVDGDGNFVLFNEAAKKMIGIGITNNPMQEWTDVYGIFLPDMKTPYPPDQLPLTRTLRGELVIEEDLFIRNENVPQGVWLSINGTPLTDRSKKITGGVIVFRDVTPHRNASNTVKRLFNAVENTDDTVFITDSKGVIEYINPAFEKTTGYSRKEAMGSTPHILKSGQHGEDYYSELWKTILGGEVFRGTVVNRKKSGELYYADQTITPMKDSNGQITHFVAVVKDMTEFRTLREQEVQMQTASLIQQKLYPQQAPELEGFDIAGAVYPAEATCGDYYDFIDLPDGMLGITIGDVSGHGIGPALIMAQTRAYLRSLSQLRSDPSTLVTLVNRALTTDLESHLFVTLLLACIDPVERSLVYANAGHNPGYVLDSRGDIKTVMSGTGLPLGILLDHEHAAKRRIDLQTGDIVVLLTDGITECGAEENRFLEDEDVLEVIKEHRDEPARQIVDHIYRKVRETAAGAQQNDDITMVICKVTGDVPGSPGEALNDKVT